MNNVKLTSRPRYRSPLRAAQAQATRDRIVEAAFALFQRGRGQEEVTFKAVASEAGVTEMTVYRHFATRDELLQGLWGKVNASIGVGMPETLDALLGRNEEVYLGYDRVAPLLLAAITSRQGREMRLSRKTQRQKAFLKVAGGISPRLSPKERTRIAAILQLLQSSYAWDSMRSNWDMSPQEIAEATRMAMESVVSAARKKEKKEKSS